MDEGLPQQQISPWYESNILWGAIGTVLTVVGAMKHNLCWLLWFSWLCFMWVIYRASKRKLRFDWALFLLLAIVMSYSFYKLKRWLCPPSPQSAVAVSINEPKVAEAPPHNPLDKEKRMTAVSPRAKPKDKALSGVVTSPAQSGHDNQQSNVGGVNCGTAQNCAGINNGAQTTISGDSDLIHTFTFTLSILVPTEDEDSPSTTTSVGSECAAALITREARVYYFQSGATVVQRQVERNRRLYVFSFQPASRSDLLYQKVASLGAIAYLHTSCSQLIQFPSPDVPKMPNGEANIFLRPDINGLDNEVYPLEVSPDELKSFNTDSGVNTSVKSVFGSLPAKYTKIVAQSAGRQ